jgi:hypothetical protein
MGLTNQQVNINFSQGLNLKQDPWQIAAGQWLSLENTVFTVGGQLKKRNGFGNLATLPTPSQYLTTLNDNLTAVGSNIQAYQAGSMQWVGRGAYLPMSVSVLPLIRNSVNQSEVDTAVAANGLVCTVYMEEESSTSTAVKFAIADSNTGQNIVAPAPIPVTSGVPTGGARVFLLGNYFVIVFTNVIGGASHLQYVAVSTANPTGTPTTNQDIALAYTPATALSWDGIVVGQSLYVGYNTQAGGQAVDVTFLTATQAAAGATPALPTSFSGQTAIGMSLCADISGSTPQIWLNWFDGSANSKCAVVNHNLAVVLAPTVVSNSVQPVNVTAVATAAVCSVFYEFSDPYTYDASIPNHSIMMALVSQSGTVTAVDSIFRGIGLGSKAFMLGGHTYFLSAYESPYQPSYFLIDTTQALDTPGTAFVATVVAKLAWENGGGYLPTGLPSVAVNGQTAQVAYLFKDLIQAVNKNTAGAKGTATNPLQTAGVYSQTGINLATFLFGQTPSIDSAEIGQSLHLSGGYLWQYDGYLPVEHNFFLYPDSVEAVWTETSTVTPTGTAASGSYTIVVSSATGVYQGMLISDATNPTYIPSQTFVVAVMGTTVTMSQATTATISGDSLFIAGQIAAQPGGSPGGNTDVYYYQALYEWTDNNGLAHRSAPSVPVPVTTTGSGAGGIITVNVPYLRLTAKIPNPPKITLYRWSVGQQNYYEVTSISQPVLNNPFENSVAIVDAQADSQILGNALIYTTGGVVENTNGPATNIMTLFDDRLWLVDAEDPNLLWQSKQVIEGTPVEMSDLLTTYIAPSTGVTGSTGPSTSLSVMDSNLIIFKKDAIYYVALGTGGPDNTGSNSGYSQPIFVSSAVGCMNQQSIVLMNDGLMFQTDKGTWLLNRSLQVSYIGAPVELYNQDTVLSAISVPATTQVRFTLNEGTTTVYDYFYQQWCTFEGIPGISSCVYDGLHTFIDQYGRVFQETEGQYLDGTSPVLMSLQSGWIKFSGLSGYERFREFILTGQYISPHLLQIQLAYDYGQPSQAITISPMQATGVYGSDDYWGQTTPWGGEGSLEQWRIFAQRQKCQAFQLSITEQYDPSAGQPAGAGLTISELNCLVAVKSGYRPVKPSKSAG